MALTRVTDKQVTYKNGGTGSVVRNLGDKLRESVSVFDFMTSELISMTQNTSLYGTGATFVTNTAAMTSAINASITASDSVYFPAGNYYFNGVSHEGSQGKTIIGDGIDRTVFTINTAATGGLGYGFKFFGLDRTLPVGFNRNMSNVRLENFTINGRDLTTVGIELNSTYEVQLHNIKSRSHNYGLSIKNTITVAATGLIDLMVNNVGLRAWEEQLTSNIDTYILFGCNVASFDTLTTADCIYAGAVIGGSTAWNIQNWLSESTPVVCYMTNNVDTFTVGSLYYEPSGTPSAITNAKKDRYGVWKYWVLFQGYDEADLPFTEGGMANIHYQSILDQGGTVNIHLYKVNGFSYNTANQRGQFECVGDCRDVSGPSLAQDNSINTLSSYGDIAVKGISANIIPYNLFPNGDFLYPNLPPSVYGSGVSTPTIVQTAIGTGIQQNCMRLALNAGSTSHLIQWAIGAAEYGAVPNKGAAVVVQVLLKASDANVLDFHVRQLDSSGNPIATVAKSNYAGYASTDWLTITCTTSQMLTVSGQPWFYLELGANRTSGAGTDYLYIAQISVRDARTKEITWASPFDIESGLTYTGTTTTGAGPRYYTEFTLPRSLYFKQQYAVVATGYGSADLAISVEKLDGTFRVWSNSNTGDVVAKVIPKMAMLP